MAFKDGPLSLLELVKMKLCRSDVQAALQYTKNYYLEDREIAVVNGLDVNFHSNGNALRKMQWSLIGMLNKRKK